MTVEDGRRRNLFVDENFPLIPSRQKEVGKILELLEESPIVFLWAPGGNGKTGFAREFRSSSPVPTSLVLGVQLRDPQGKTRSPYDQEITEESKIVIVDEVKVYDELTFNKIVTYVKEGKKFVFLLHDPKSRYMNDRQYHKRREEYMNRLINMFSDAPWLYLRKWNPNLPLDQRG